MALTGSETMDVGGADLTGRPSPLRVVTTTGAVAALTQSGASVSTYTATAGFTAGVAPFSAAADVTFLMTGTLAAGQSLTLPGVGNLANALPLVAAAAGSWKFRLVNASAGAFSWTVASPGGSWTLNGTMTVAQNTWREFVVGFTSLTAMTLTSVGTGTYS